MIKGIYLRIEPYMDKFTEQDILAALDPFDEDSGPEVYNQAYKMTRRTFSSPKFTISIYRSDSNQGIGGLWTVFDTLQTGAPKFLKSFRLAEDTIVVAFPHTGDDFKYERLMDELERLTVFLLKQDFLLREDIPGLIKTYIETSIFYGEQKATD